MNFRARLTAWASATVLRAPLWLAQSTSCASRKIFFVSHRSASSLPREHPHPYHGTTILCVRKANKVVMIGDGQVTLGQMVVKPNARKVRVVRPGIVGGFAGTAADAFTLFELLEEKIDKYQGQLLRSCVELAKAWRTDKYLRQLEAVMIVADKDLSLTLTGSGDVMEPHDGVIGVGSGGGYALAAARAMMDIDGYDAETIARKAMKIAAELCIYTNDQFVIETIDTTAASVQPSTASTAATTTDNPIKS